MMRRASNFHLCGKRLSHLRQRELIASVQMRPVRSLDGGTIEEAKVKEGVCLKYW
ncbi:MAG: hypothetical protein KME25_32835 [Symplocastrum torsivum CPER-KK1]|uniref:Uncharacterized protein n=1 Tax=Symplocastrum torsivum CPER-KK1 TaxID=450513 RepID=A0A951PTL8_9CYAN|nr:hypothetical protein [Symplocastrum torsivum CPER-KK1]